MHPRTLLFRFLFSKPSWQGLPWEAILFRNASILACLLFSPVSPIHFCLSCLLVAVESKSLIVLIYSVSLFVHLLPRREVIV